MPFEEAARQLRAKDVAGIVRSEQKRVRQQGVVADGVRDELQLLLLNDTSRIRRCADAELTRGDDWVALNFNDQELRIPPVAFAALDALMMSTSVSIGELAGLNAASRMVLARRLLREGAAHLENN